MKYFITGGAGFIGSHLTEQLLQAGHSVTVYDNFSSGSEAFLARSPHLKVIAADLREEKTLALAMKGHDFVYHLAANPDVRLGERNPRIELDNGILITFNVLEAMRKNGLSLIAFSSSSVIYGEPTVFPTPEHYGPLMPISLYGASKLSSEALVSAYCGTYGFSGWIFRFANVIGSRATHGLIYDLIQKLNKNPRELEVLGDGKQKKAYIHVSDCVRAMHQAVGKSNGLHIYNIGNDKQVTVAEIAKLLLEHAGLSETKIRYTGGKRGWHGDVTQMLLAFDALKKTGWTPQLNSHEAVVRAIQENLHELRRA